MAEKSDVCKGLAVIWKTERAKMNRDRSSSVFSMFGATWQLRMSVNFYGNNFIELRQIGHIAPNAQFTSTIYLQTTGGMKDYNFQAHGHRCEAVSKGYFYLLVCDWEKTSKVITPSNDCPELTVVCVFTLYPSALPGMHNEAVEVTTQTDFDSILPLKTLHDDNLSSGEGEQGASCVSSNLDSLSGDLSKLLEDEVLPDITLRCGDRTVAAHRAVLAARSKVFSAMFQSKMSESETGVVDITDIDADVLELFLKYLYTGKLFESSNEVLLSLYAAGEKYAVTALTMACFEHLINNLTQENCFKFLLMADAHNNQEFKNAIFNFILNHVEIISNSEWKTFCKENLALSHEVLEMIVKQKCLK